MDIANFNNFAIGPRGSKERDPDRYKRGTISVGKRESLPEDAKWHGSAPMPVPETDKNWRPSEFKF